MCRANFPRWAYNPETQQCEKFSFGGCGGNANNFYSYQQCANRCPDMVMCPQQSPLGEMTSCSRNEACDDQECNGYPEATCSVDPCTCSPLYLDSDGKIVKCLPAEIPMDVEPRHAVPEASSTTTTTTTTKATTTTTTTEATTTTTTTTSTPAPRGKSLNHPHHTRCQKMRQTQLKHGRAGELIPECDHLGRFQPIQCLPAKSTETSVRCWCVDEAGNQVANTTQFLRGEQTCRKIKFNSIPIEF